MTSETTDTWPAPELPPAAALPPTPPVPAPAARAPFRERSLRLPAITAIAAGTLLVGGGIGAAIGYAAHSDGPDLPGRPGFGGPPNGVQGGNGFAPPNGQFNGPPGGQQGTQPGTQPDSGSESGSNS